MALLSTKTGLPSFAAADNAIVNYFTDGGFERGSNGVIPSGWAQYNDGAVAVPVDGTGGSAVAQVTMLCTNSSPIRGLLSAVISKDANNRQGVGYSFDFTISNADKGITAGVNFELLTSANYVSGDMVFYIYDVTNSILITPRTVSLPALPSYGKFFSDYGLTTGTSYRFILHIATTSALAYTVTLDTMVNTTTRVAVPGSIVTGRTAFTPTFSGVTITNNGSYWSQNGSDIEVSVDVSATADATTSVLFNMFGGIPGSLTVDTSKIGSRAAVGSGAMATAGNNVVLVPTYSGSGDTCSFRLQDDGVLSNTSPTVVGGVDNGDRIIFTAKYPVSQWSGSGSNFGPGASVEYLSSGFSSWVTDRSGAGTALPTTTPAGTNENVSTPFATAWQNAMQPVDAADIEVQHAGVGPWIPLPSSEIAPLQYDGTNYIGLGFEISSTNIRVLRGKYRTANTAAAVAWSTMTAGTRYRLVKARPDSPVGQALVSSTNGNGLMPYLNSSYDNATATQLGLKSYYHGTTYNGGNAPTVSSAQAGFSHVRSAFVPYQMQDGTWRMKFNINYSYTATAVSNIAGTSINGVVFAAEGAQALSGATNSGTGVVAINSWTNENTNTISYYHSASYTNGKAFISGDVELESKPTWAY